MTKCAVVLLACCLVSSDFVRAAAKSSVEGDAKQGPQQRWSCFATSDGRARQQQVERDMLPRVVFAGETQPASVESRMAKHKSPALSVAVVHKGKLDWRAAWGHLQNGGARAGCDSLFQAGSIAKPVTLLAAMRMKQKGLLDFDANIEKYLSSYVLPAGAQTDANPVTFRNLFAHTSGITPGGYQGYEQGQPLPTDQQTARAEAPSNSRKVEVLTAPGATLAYSGGGYTVVEIALQDQLRKPFAQIMQEWLLSPVGMKQASFALPLPTAQHRHTARGHQADGNEVAGGWRQHPEQAAAGLWATSADLATFLIEIHKGYQGDSKIFTQATIRELLAKPFDGHAYGFRLIGEGENIFVTHYGGTVGYRAGMSLNLHTGNGAVFLSNTDNGGNLGAEFFAAVSRAYNWPRFREIQVKRVARSADELQSLAGQYLFAEQDWKVTAAYENETLILIFPNGDRYPLTPIEGAARSFIHADTAVRARFEGEGADLRIQLYGQTGKRQTN